ncbi:MAG: hypothetical protein ABII27_02495 [bacterium]
MDNFFFTALWAFPAIIFAALVIAWAAECSQFMIAQGLALAILAWLQTLPEFAVEAVIAFEAGKDPSKIHLITANFTGSLRLLVGLGWPLVFFTQLIFNLKRLNSNWRNLLVIRLEDYQAINVIALLLPLVYFIFILMKQSLSVYDGLILVGIYILYLFVLKKLPPKDEDEIESVGRIPKMVLRQPVKFRGLLIISLFLAGGIILFFSARPFLHSMLGIAVFFGISQFIFVQWLAPFLSEFPEKISAFYWARTPHRAPMALTNLICSNINQWTVLIGMVPFIYVISLGSFKPIVLDAFQTEEIILTMLQSALGMLLLCKMYIKWYEIVGLFILWFMQFILPPLRIQISMIYAVWCIYEVVLFFYKVERRKIIYILKDVYKKHLAVAN